MSSLLWYLNFELSSKFSIFLSQLLSFIFYPFSSVSPHLPTHSLHYSFCLSIFTSSIGYIGWFNCSGFWSPLTRRSLEWKYEGLSSFSVYSWGGNNVCNKAVALLHLATAWAHNPLFIPAVSPLPLFPSLTLFQHTKGNSWNEPTSSHAGRLTHSRTRWLCSWS